MAMSQLTPWHAEQAKIPLNPALLKDLNAEDLGFYQQQTGIKNLEQLREHIAAIQARAFLIFPYPCIRRFSFTRLKISAFHSYQEVLELGRERPGAILLDLGCCFGNDARKAIADGFPGNQTLAIDLRGEFWQLGHELFRDTAESCPVPPHLTSLPTSGDILAACVAQQSLNPVQNLVSVIHASAFFHLFTQEHQLEVARRCALLLSTEPGSIIFGSHRGALVPGSRGENGGHTFAHSPESWKEMWGTIVPGGSVQVDAWLSDEETSVSETYTDDEKAADENGVALFTGHWLVWCVRRI
ncbi:hypothetical protein BKA62DRAFT_704316 [Auriculariales sp. MPI-PUGE-AT-0066]|nr:hypothetical protein BKA62DRAFT_704316 [Auriculariales sp. MPI-PUGE-AT-0066]